MLMIFVTLGTQDKEFKRLLLEIERLIYIGVIKDDVVAQIGNTKFESNKMKIIKFTYQDEMEELIKSADIIITHGGVGTIIEGINLGKKIIAVPRLKKYKEHVNDHQLQIIQNFNDNGYIIGVNSVDEIEIALEKIKDFIPKKYKSNKQNFLDKLENSIIM